MTPMLKLRTGGTQEATPATHNVGHTLHDMNQGGDEHPFRRPKLHLFKKDASRRIKTSSATRNLQPIFPFMVHGDNTNSSMMAI